MPRLNLLSEIVLGCAFTLLSATTVFAADNGFYLGGQVGWGDIHDGGITAGDMKQLIRVAAGPFNTPTFDTNSTSDSSDSGIAGRLYLGYQFDCHWATEFAWSRFRTTSTGASATALDLADGPINANASGSVKTNAFELLGKGTLPLEYNGLSVYGKVGIAYIYERISSSATVNDDGLVQSGSIDRTEGQVYPEFGIGVAYDFTPKIVADITWMRIQEVGYADLSSTDFWGIGLNYHFS